MSPRIVMVASAVGTADPRIAKEASALVAAGFEVVVLAWDRSGSQARVVDREGWRIEHLGSPAAHGAGLRNLTGYVRFWREAGLRARELRPDVVHCHNLDSAPAGIRAMRGAGRRGRLVMDFWEIYPESRVLAGRGVGKALARVVARRLERAAIARSDLVIIVGHGQMPYFRSRGAEHVIVVENAPDVSRYTPVTRDEPDFVISFIGQKRWLPSLVTLMDAIQPYPRLRALLVGGGTAAGEVATIAAGKERVEVRGRVEAAEIPALYQGCDAVYACYDTSLLNWRTAYPVKAMEAMAMALPVLVTRGTYAAEYVERHGVGLAVDDRDPADVARALVALESDRELSHSMGRRGREIAERELNWTAASGRLVEGYAALCGTHADGVD